MCSTCAHVQRSTSMEQVSMPPVAARRPACRIVSVHGACMATGGWIVHGDEGGSHGPTCPPHRRPSAFPIVLFPHTADSCVRTHTHTHSPLHLQSYTQPRRSHVSAMRRSTISICFMINLQAWTDALRYGLTGMIHFNHSDVNIPTAPAGSN